jgi:hypothetical protein
MCFRPKYRPLARCIICGTYPLDQHHGGPQQAAGRGAGLRGPARVHTEPGRDLQPPGSPSLCQVASSRSAVFLIKSLLVIRSLFRSFFHHFVLNSCSTPTYIVTATFFLSVFTLTCFSGHLYPFGLFSTVRIPLVELRSCWATRQRLRFGSTCFGFHFLLDPALLLQQGLEFRRYTLSGIFLKIQIQ